MAGSSEYDALRHATLEALEIMNGDLSCFLTNHNEVGVPVTREYFSTENVSLPGASTATMEQIILSIPKADIRQALIIDHCLAYLADFTLKGEKSFRTVRAEGSGGRTTTTALGALPEARNSVKPRIANRTLNEARSSEVGAVICFALIGFGCRGALSKENKSKVLFNDLFNSLGFRATEYKNFPNIPLNWTRPHDGQIKTAACILAYISHTGLHKNLVPTFNYGFVNPACHGHMVLESRLTKLKEIGPFMLRNPHFVGAYEIQAALAAAKRFEEEVTQVGNRTIVTVSRLVSQRYLQYLTGPIIKCATAMLLLVISLIEGGEAMEAWWTFINREHNKGCVSEMREAVIRKIVDRALKTEAELAEVRARSDVGAAVIQTAGPVTNDPFINF